MAPDPADQIRSLLEEVRRDVSHYERSWVDKPNTLSVLRIVKKLLEILNEERKVDPYD